MSEVNEGVKILIDRMETNPEDFEDRDFEPTTGRITRGKFKGVADMLKKRLSGERPAWDAMNVLTTEEIEALTAAYLEMERRKFTNGIMARLLEDDKVDSYAYTGGGGTGFSAQPVVFGSNGTTAMTLSANGNLGVGTQPKNAVTIAPYANGPTIDFNRENITTLNEMIEAWRKHDE